jgi:NADPH:quinone reductase-like Zn-dependent oxidoreductase
MLEPQPVKNHGPSAPGARKDKAAADERDPAVLWSQTLSKYEVRYDMLMRAMAIVGGVGLDHLKLIERPIPEPRHSEIVIRISAVSLNYWDMDMVLGTYPFSFPLPLVPTSDGVGEVVAVGEGVTRAKVGDRVLGSFHQSWIAVATRRALLSSADRPTGCWRNTYALTSRASFTHPRI